MITTRITFIMAVTIFGNIQHRRGIKADLPVKLEEGELGFCVDTRELFIGNTPALGGNTQIFTDTTQIAQVTDYQFVSDTSVISQTGVTANQPVIRTLQQQLDDAWVNVKAYGAKGDGITDDTVAINRAIADLYTKQLTTSENVSQSRKTLWFPSGAYLISSPILLYPEVSLQGESVINTTITLVNVLVPQPAVIRLADSLGQINLQLGVNGAQMPHDQKVQNLTLHTQNAACVALLERPDGVWFESCVFSGNWQVGDPVVPGSEVTGVVIKTLGAFVYGGVWISDCVFENLEWALYSTDTIQNVAMTSCTFKQLYLAVNLAGTPGPLYVKINSCMFDQISNQAIKALSTQFVSSQNNTFMDVNSGGVSIFWDTTTSLCTSVNDQFENIPGINNLGTQNLIVNAQQNNLVASSALSTQQVDATITSTNTIHFPTMLASASGGNVVQTAALLTFNPSTNRLGVGTAAPTYNLHVVGDARVAGPLTTAGRYRNIRIPTGTTPYTDAVQLDDDVIVVRTLADTVQLDLPTGVNGRCIVIKDGENNAAVNNITVQPAGSDAVDTLATTVAYVINTNNASITLMFDGTLNRWHLI